MYLETQNPRVLSGHEHYETNYYICVVETKKIHARKLKTRFDAGSENVLNTTGNSKASF